MCEATPKAVARAFSDVLLGARRRRNLEPATVAARGRIDLEDLKKLEHGQDEPRLSLFIRSAVGVGVSPAWLLEEVLAWLNINEGDPESRRNRVLAVGSALTSVLLGSSEADLNSTSALGERLQNELAKHGLLIITLTHRVFRSDPK